MKEWDRTSLNSVMRKILGYKSIYSKILDMQLSQLLVEGRKDDFLKKFREKFTNDELKSIFLLSRDLASNHKYLMFLGNALESGNIDINKVKEVIGNFIKYQKVLPVKDIYLYDKISDIQTAIETHENKVRRDVKELDGAKQVYEDERFVVVTPETHDASCYYGAGTKWCTASKQGSSHFDTYNRDGKLFYIIDKKAKSQDRFYKVALLQKYHGDQVFFDAPDRAFTNEWILGTPEWEKINSNIQKYLKDNFERELEIFKDKEAARLEMVRIRNQQQRERNARKLRDAQDRKNGNEWSIDEDTEESNKANAVFEVIVDNYGLSLDDDETIYDLVPADYPHSGLDTFEWLGLDFQNSTWAVGDWDEVREAAIEDQRNLIDDTGLEGWNQSFVESHIDTDSVLEYFSEVFEQDIYESPESYFDESDLPLSDKQEYQVSKLEEEAEELDEITRNVDGVYNEDEVELAEDRWNEINDEIEDIKSDPEGEPTVGMVEEVLENRLHDVKMNILGHMNDWGLLLEDYVDIDSLVRDAIDMDGTGPSLGPYDGIENEAVVNNTTYFVYRVE